MKRFIALCLTVVLALSLLAGCSSKENSAAKEVTLSSSYTLTEFHPVTTPEHATDNSFMYYASNFYNTLIRYENGSYVPELAESFSVSDDGLVYTFILKQGVKFSDGEELNADAVKKCYESIPIRLGQYNGSYGRISALFDKIVAVDAQTLEIHLSAPYYGAPKDLTMVIPMGIVSPNAFNDDGTVKADTKTKTFGTGAYMYTGINDGTTFTFEQNPNYWGEKPEVESFKIKVIPDNDAKVLALKNGEIDAIIGVDKISFDAYNEMKSTTGFAGISTDKTDKTRLIGFNVTTAPFDDPAVRKAVSHAIDKNAICEGLFDGLEAKADNLLDKSLLFCDVDVPVYAFDAQKAKDILEQAGWVDSDGDGIREKNGTKLSAEGIYMAGNAMLDELAQVLAVQMKDVGIELNIQGIDMMAYVQKTMDGTWNLSLSATYGAIFDPCTLVGNMDPRFPMDPVAMMMLAPSGKAEAMLDHLNSQTNEDGVRDAYHAILTSIAENASCDPISYTRELMVYNSEKIAGYSFTDYPTQIFVNKIDLK